MQTSNSVCIWISSTLLFSPSPILAPFHLFIIALKNTQILMFISMDSPFADSVLSAEAQEFVPSFRKAPVAANNMSANLGPPIPQQQFIQQQQQPYHHHHSQQNHHPHHQPSLNHMPQHLGQNHHHQQHHHNNHHHHHNRQNNSYSVQNRLSQFNGTISGGRPQGHHPHQQSAYHHPHQPHHQHHQQQQQAHMRGGVPNGVAVAAAPNINQAQHQLQQLNIASHFEGTDGQGSEPTEAELHALSFLLEVMEKLNSNPGKFEDYQKELTTLYIEFAENHHVISNAIELIFTQVCEMNQKWFVFLFGCLFVRW